MLTSISPDRLENLRSRIERAEDAAKRLDGDIGRMWAERYAGDVAFLLGALAAPSPETGTAAVPTRLRECTCVDRCKGTEGLAVGWRCGMTGQPGTCASTPAAGTAPTPEGCQRCGRCIPLCAHRLCETCSGGCRGTRP